MISPQLDMMARVVVDERNARLRKVDRTAWMREEAESEFARSPFRPAGLIMAILALALVGRMFLI